jgi:CheY-like chemotaxis protein
VSEIVDTALETVRALVEQRQQTVVVEGPGAPIHVDGDGARLSQVLANVLDNAARYSAPGSRIELAAHVAGDHVTLKVSDQGAGIERDLLPRIFDLFVQGHRAPQPDGGLGIGLPLARRLVEMHNGTINCYSAGPGRGTEVTIRLPLSAGKESSDDVRTSAKPVPLPRRRVLIVEDNPDTAEMMDLLLKEWGQETRIATDGIAALEIAKEFRPEIVLLDIGLPRLHGYEVARRMRQQSWASSAYVVAITGWGLEADRQGEAAGIDRRMLKPVDPAILRDVLAGAPRR